MFILCKSIILGAPTAQLGERQTLDCKVPGLILKPGRCDDVLEQDTSSILLSTG